MWSKDGEDADGLPNEADGCQQDLTKVGGRETNGNDKAIESVNSALCIPGEEQAFQIFMALLARGRGGGRQTSLFNLSELWEESLCEL